MSTVTEKDASRLSDEVLGDLVRNPDVFGLSKGSLKIVENEIALRKCKKETDMNTNRKPISLADIIQKNGRPRGPNSRWRDIPLLYSNNKNGGHEKCRIRAQANVLRKARMVVGDAVTVDFFPDGMARIRRADGEPYSLHWASTRVKKKGKSMHGEVTNACITFEKYSGIPLPLVNGPTALEFDVRHDGIWFMVPSDE